jgi:hypothetical protein
MLALEENFELSQFLFVSLGCVQRNYSYFGFFSYAIVAHVHSQIPRWISSTLSCYFSPFSLPPFFFFSPDERGIARDRQRANGDVKVGCGLQGYYSAPGRNNISPALKAPYFPSAVGWEKYDDGQDSMIIDFY